MSLSTLQQENTSTKRKPTLSWTHPRTEIAEQSTTKISGEAGQSSWSHLRLADLEPKLLELAQAGRNSQMVIFKTCWRLNIDYNKSGKLLRSADVGGPKTLFFILGFIFRTLTRSSWWRVRKILLWLWQVEGSVIVMKYTQSTLHKNAYSTWEDNCTRSLPHLGNFSHSSLL